MTDRIFDSNSTGRKPVRNVTEEEISAYSVDGAVVLRQITPEDWIEPMPVANERVLANPGPGPFGMDYNKNENSGRFYGDLFPPVWQRI